MKGVPFCWNEDCEVAFVQLQRRLVEPPILAYPDFSKRFQLHVGSSRIAVRACLMQHIDGRDRVVAYANRVLGYLLGNQKVWRYLDRQEFDLYTDHKTLTWVFNENNRTSNAKLARWAVELSHLLFKVYHKAGKSMGHVDGLSRLYQATINALTMEELLNEADMDEGDSSVEVGESRPLGIRNDESGKVGDRETIAREEEEADLTDPPVPSQLEEFGFDPQKFKEEQHRTPWIMALIAFLESSALALDGQLRVKTLQLAPHYEVRK
ncbi:hypothetical protein PC120_g16249 [Phytophthora cactorum]|nr:hypothetical protein PC120_g16249 [Phytophthora cactorum]